MYTKCREVERARHLFDSVLQPDTVSWNALIQGYVENGQPCEALHNFTAMKDQCYHPDARTFVSALMACSELSAEERASSVTKLRSIERGMVVHQQALVTFSDIFVGNALIDFYANVGIIHDARLVFDRMPAHDVVSWTCLLLGYIANGEARLALEMFFCMESRGSVTGNSRTYSAALMACSALAGEGQATNLECVEKGLAIHSLAERTLCDSDVFLKNNLIGMYTRCGAMSRARDVFDNMQLFPDVVSWTLLIQGYVENGQKLEALSLFMRMRLEGCRPDSRAFIAAMTACWNLKELKEIHRQAEESGYLSNLYVVTAAVNMYSRLGSVSDSLRTFEGISGHSNVVLWNSLIIGLADNGENEKSLDMFMLLLRDQSCQPDARSFVAALTACASLSSQNQPRKFFETGSYLHSEALKLGFDDDIYVGNALIHFYSKFKCIENAVKVFKRMKVADVVSWTSMMLGYVENGQPNRALELLTSMTCTPNSRTYVVALVACSRVVAAETGKSVQAEVYKLGLETDPVVEASLVDLHGKCGSLSSAQLVFDSSLNRGDVVIWNALMAGYSLVGDTLRAFDVFERMEEECVGADSVTFFCLLAACSHGGEVERGVKVLMSMSGRGVAPGVEHLTCVVDMFGRANRVEEALKVVERMWVKPDQVTWLAVLSACEKWGNVGAGEVAFEKLVEGGGVKLGVAHVLLANLYALNK